MMKPECATIRCTGRTLSPLTCQLRSRVSNDSIGETAVALQRRDCVAQLDRGRHIADQHAPRAQRTRRHAESAARLGEIEEQPVDAGLGETGEQVAESERPVRSLAKNAATLRRAAAAKSSRNSYEMTPRADRAQERDRQRAGADAALDNRGAGKTSPQISSGPVSLG